MHERIPRWLPLLAFLSGTCGIAYEVLYSQLLTSFFGDIFYVTAVILAMFFTGIAIGSVIGARAALYLPYVEMGIGFYGIALAALLHTLGLRFTEFIVRGTTHESGVLIVVIVVLLAVPTVLIGISVPGFARYLEEFGVKGQKRFIYTYGLYNVGAAISVIAVEYLGIRFFGMTHTVFIIAFINCLIGATLLFCRRDFSQHDVPSLTRKVTTVLFALSAASGVAQLLLFNIAQQVIGPLNENLSLLIGSSLIALSIASWITARRSVSLAAMSLLCGATLLIVFLVLSPAIIAYGELFTILSSVLGGVPFARLIFVFLTVLPVMVTFGLSIPIVTRAQGNAAAPKALGISALGNACGYLLYLFFFYEIADPVTIMGGIVIVLFGIATLLGFSLRSVACAYCVLFAASISASLWWPSYLGIVPYSAIHDRAYVAQVTETIRTVEEYRKYGNNTIVAERTNGEQMLLLNGYHTLTFDRQQKTLLHELLLGIMPAYFNADRSRALVFGLGSGITATAVADLYDTVTVAEINPAMLEAAKELTALNDFVLDKPNARVVIQDGLVTLLQSTTTYDAIINTVTTPAYFSANKLWTRDVFLEIKKKLTPRGVFAGWVDVRLGSQGEAIMEKTLLSVFDECVLGYLNSGYFGFVCGAAPLRLVDVKDDELPDKYLSTLTYQGWRTSPRDFLPQLLFRSSQDVTQAEGMNTLDKPLLRYRYLLDDEAWQGRPLEPILSKLAIDPFTPEKPRDTRQCTALRMVTSHFLYTCPVAQH